MAALSFVLGVLFTSGILEKVRFYATEALSVDPITNQPIHDIIGADALYNYSQHMNNVFVIMAIILILAVVTLYITATNKRRNYYVTNYVSIGIVVAFSVAFAIFLMAMCGTCISLANQIDMAQWKTLSETSGYPSGYSENYATIILGFILAVIILLEAAAWVLNLLWKIKLMKGEKALLAGDFAKEVA
ncbi:MAG: hypothetical protein K2O67_02020 [Clostridia bacterium]|nr:hypothetical protein [Clostridia bacterium]